MNEASPSSSSSLALLVVADIDLSSAARLAEHALFTPALQGGRVDCILVCGPLVKDLEPYYNHRRRMNTSTPELNCAKEGLITGALSQLESIVCRVIWIPSVEHDPITLLKNSMLRLTPNSRNVHNQCLPLARGLCCMGMVKRKQEEEPTTNREEEGQASSSSLNR